MSKYDKLDIENILDKVDALGAYEGMSRRAACEELGVAESSVRRWQLKAREEEKQQDEEDETGITAAKVSKGAKILTVDIETAPMKAAVWKMFDNNVSLDMIETDWHLLSYCAKWKHLDEVMYRDQRDSVDIEDDGPLLEDLWSLLDQADIVQGQNSVRFDTKKINARLIINGYGPPSSYRHIDSLKIAKKHLAMTSNKLDYLSQLCKVYKKSRHAKFPGYLLWKGCLEGNMEAWQEMEEYNIFDVLATEELIGILAPWSSSIPNMDTYHDGTENICYCGSEEWTQVGYYHTNLGKYDKFSCDACGAERKGRINLLPKEKRATLRANTLK